MNYTTEQARKINEATAKLAIQLVETIVTTYREVDPTIALFYLTEHPQRQHLGLKLPYVDETGKLTFQEIEKLQVNPKTLEISII